ncbi:hypothetical protein [Flavobacterium xueshanense]|uniref:Lipocalin-like domain-containing protein n=1 Tax=Flavobacterium xueshanense TaxID=935223 RepID=A0A1I2EBS3_9FLAO|nr:hypothetical protein [Flavobacterium xueshanense]SFE90117.1 hypothetical protein SAMN04488131_105153 [Flavobacterium xueshanense]
MKKVIIFCLFLFLSSCSNDDNGTNTSGNNAFIGIWKNDEIGGQKLTIQFNSDFTFYYSAGNQKGTYTLNGNIATINLNTTNNSTATIIDKTHINWVVIWTKK